MDSAPCLNEGIFVFKAKAQNLKFLVSLENPESLFFFLLKFPRIEPIPSNVVIGHLSATHH